MRTTEEMYPFPEGDGPRVWWSPTEGYIFWLPKVIGHGPQMVRAHDRRVIKEFPFDSIEMVARETPIPWPEPVPDGSLIQGSIQRGIDDAAAGRVRRSSWVTGEQLDLFEAGLPEEG